jgi:hypothetical protein
MVGRYHSRQNDYLISSKVNKTFDELLRMGDQAFITWIKQVCKEAIYAWDEMNMPPEKGSSDREILRQFEIMSNLDTLGFLRRGELTYAEDCIVNNSRVGSACNAFFPNIGKVKDIQGTSLTGNSIYDCFKDPINTQGIVNAFAKNFKRDSFYAFSPVVTKTEAEIGVNVKSAKQWIMAFKDNRPNALKNHDFWIAPVKKVGRRSGQTPLSLSKRDLDDLTDNGYIEKRHLTNLKDDKIAANTKYLIRLFERGQKVFPTGFNFFKTGFHISATNFPPATAKFIYRHFTDDLADQDRIIVYDPSAGFGGRLLGALSLNTDRQIHYVGTDPNPDNWIPELNRSRYEYMAEHFNNNVRRRKRTTYEIFQLGSEVVHKDKRFQKYKGKVDLVFTSPPYFAAEGYSEDENQSFKKFPNYSLWRDGFLRQTLSTAFNYLKPKRWLIFNIADVSFDGKYYPLEQDTVSICESLGLEYRGKLKMVLAITPGANRLNKHTALPSTKNFCQINGNLRKYEPVLTFWKG